MSTAPIVASLQASGPLVSMDGELGGERGHLNITYKDTHDEAREHTISTLERTTHQIGQDSWWFVGFHLVAALNIAFILGYPALIMAYLGWTAGVILLLGGGRMSLYNNCLLGSLHEIGGVRHIQYRDLCGYVYGAFMFNITWIIQFTNLSIANVGLIILGGQLLKAIGGVEGMTLSHWIIITGVSYVIFAIAMPNLSTLKYFSAFTLVLSFMYIMIALAISIKDGIHALPRDYSIIGSNGDKVFNAIGALATIAFAFNIGILPEIQATIKSPTARNIKKALGLQFTVGTVPFLVLTFTGYWAYGNLVFPYLIINLSGQKWAITCANLFAFLQALVVFHIYATPMYEFFDTFVATKVAPNVQDQGNDFSVQKIFLRFVFRGAVLILSTFLACLLPFFGDFIALTGSLMAFTLQGRFIHHMIIKVQGKDLSTAWLTWHWVNVFVNAIVMVACLVATIHYLIHDSITYHVFTDL